MSTLRRLGLYLRKNPGALLGVVIVAIYILLVPLAPLLAPYSPVRPTDEFRTPPSLDHPFGTDNSGLDVFSRVLYSPRTDLVVGVAGTLISMVIGVPLGLVVGYSRGFLPGLVLRIADLLQAFPVFVLAMALVSVTGNNILNVIYVIGFLNAPIYVRLVRSQVLSFRERPVIEAARCVGNGYRSVLWRYLLPNTVEPALVQASVNVGWAILLTASLSFIGAGVPVPTPEWGSMVAIGAPMMIVGEWWAAFFPGVAMALCVLGFALVGDAVRVLVNPERSF